MGDAEKFLERMLPKPVATPEERQVLYIKKSREHKSKKGYKTREHKKNSTWLRQSHQFIFGADIRDDTLIASKLRDYLDEHYPLSD